MGIDIKSSEFSADDHRLFQDKLFQNLTALRRVLDNPQFGLGKGSVGAELELYIVDENSHPLAANTDIHDAAADPQLTLELNRYNLEFNLTPVGIDDKPFNTIEQEIIDKLRGLNQTATSFGARILPIGILPTAKRDDFGPDFMTPLERYHALSEALRKRRGDSFSVNINGKDAVSVRADDLTFEGANTSFQLHYRIDPRRFRDTYNAIQLVTPLVLAAGANSPFFLGQRLWHETRVPLFKQSIDGRDSNQRTLHVPSRVEFGHGWTRHGAYELFAESVHLHRPILPVCGDSDPIAELDQGRLPSLYELRLHQGTTWKWNRPVYDHHKDGHLRVEMRSLPAGPTPADMMANFVFHIGLAEGLRDQVEELIPALPFQLLAYNFYRAAQFGLGAKLLWPTIGKQTLVERDVCEIALSLIDSAKQGLQNIGISSEESDPYLEIITRRLETRSNGASWQLQRFERYFEKHSRDEALKMMLHDYGQRVEENRPFVDR